MTADDLGMTMTEPLDLTDVLARADLAVRFCSDRSADAQRIFQDDIPRLVGEVESLRTRVETFRALLEEMVDDDECSYDHHGYCQTHHLGERPCEYTRARELLADFGVVR